MHMSIMYPRVDACIFPIVVMLTLYVITAIDLAIKVMIEEGITCSPTTTSGTVMINMEAVIKDISNKDLHGTR